MVIPIGRGCDVAYYRGVRIEHRCIEQWQQTRLVTALKYRQMDIRALRSMLDFLVVMRRMCGRFKFPASQMVNVEYPTAL